MMQKLKDLSVLVKGSRKAQVLLFVGVLVLFSYFFLSSSPKKVKKINPQKEELANKLGDSSVEETRNDIMARVNQEFVDLKKQNDESKQELEQLRKQQVEYEQRTAEILKKMLEKIQDTQSSSVPQVSIPAPLELGDTSGISGNLPMDDGASQSASLEAFGPLNDPQVAPPPPVSQKKIAYVGAGDSVRVKLLAGVNAPTDGSPYPVVFKLVGDVFGPDNSSLPLGEARLIAASQGSITDSRALFRLTSLNIRLPSGERKVLNVDGWIVGEDGIRGMQGVLIDPIGRAIAGAGAAGAVAGFGQGIQSARTRVSNNPLGGVNTEIAGDIQEYAAGAALSESAREWSSIIRERLRELVPVVQVLSGREGTAVFAKSLQIEDLFQQLEYADGLPGGLD